MRHRALAVVVALMALGAPAHAETLTPSPPACACPAEVRVPERDAAVVPANAKRWLLGAYGAVHYAGRVPAAQLMGVHAIEHALPANAPADITPPAAPRDVRVAMTPSGVPLLESASRTDVSSLHIDAVYDADVALVRIDIRDDDGIVSLLTTPQRAYLCEPGFYLTKTLVEVEVRAIDLAGNESEPATLMVARSVSSSAADACRPPQHQISEAPCGTVRLASDGWHDDHNHNHNHDLELLYLYYFLFLFVCFIVFVGRRIWLTPQPAQPIARLVAEGVVHRILRWKMGVTAVLVLGAIGLHAAGVGVYRSGTTVMPFIVAPFVLVAILGLARARRVRRLLERPDAVTMRCGRWLVVQTPQRSAKIRAANNDFEVAARSAIPRSEIR